MLEFSLRHMQFKIFLIPVHSPATDEAEMNTFLRSHRTLAAEKEFVSDGRNSFWTFCVEYIDPMGSQGPASGKGPEVDYKEVLKPDEFELFSRLREWRRAVAEAEGVPVYTILTNQQLALMVQRKVVNKSGLQEIEGVGEARVAKYGETLLGILAAETPKGA